MEAQGYSELFWSQQRRTGWEWWDLRDTGLGRAWFGALGIVWGSSRLTTGGLGGDLVLISLKSILRA